MIAETIQRYIERLPVPLQTEVLDFVQYLLTKVERGNFHEETAMWSDLSLTFAMNGMEDEDSPEYTAVDLTDVF